MTNTGMAHVRDIRVTQRLLESREKVYIYAGVKNLVQQMQIWLDFLNIRNRNRPVREAPIFKVLEVLKAIPCDAPITLRSEAVMLLFRLREGLNVLPKADALKGSVQEIVEEVRNEIGSTLVALQVADVISELRERYLALSLAERERNASKYVLLGLRSAFMRQRVEAGEATIIIYRLENLFARITPWQIMDDIRQELSTNYQTIAQSLASACDSLQQDYEENSKALNKEDKPIALPEEFGQDFSGYLAENLKVSAQAVLPEREADDLLKQTRKFADTICSAYLNPIVLTEPEDGLQAEIIEELRRQEPELFYKEGDTNYIHSLRWIMRNIRERKSGAEVNLSGDVSSRLDGIFNSVFKLILRKSVYAIISEEDKPIIYGIAGRKQKGYRLVLFLDPIDGSSQIADGGSFGSIFTIGFLRPGQTLEGGDFDPRKQVLLGFDLQYGPSTFISALNPCNNQAKPELVQFSLTNDEDGALSFRKILDYISLLDTEGKLSWEGLLPKPSSCGPIQLALGGSLVESLPEDGHKEFINWLIQTYGYQPAYSGALLNDERKKFLAHVNLPQRAGVLYAYSRTGSHKDGRLRYPFEGIYYALCSYALGGEVIDGIEPLLNNKIEGDQPSDKQVPYYSGSSWITKFKLCWFDFLSSDRSGKQLTDEYLLEAWDRFLSYYKTESKRLIKEIIDASEGKVTEQEVRHALLGWDSLDRKENYFPRLLGLEGNDAYNELFPNISGSVSCLAFIPFDLKFIFIVFAF